jgi:hypothetical protein
MMLLFGISGSVLIEKKFAWYLVVDALMLAFEVVKIEVFFQANVQFLTRFGNKDIDIFLFDASPKFAE